MLGTRNGFGSLAVMTLWLCCPAQQAQGQPVPLDIDPSKYPTGHMLPSADELMAFPIATLTRAYIPEAVDLSDRFPQPKQQKHGSCVAWAVGYAARSYYTRIESGRPTFDPSIIASPAYIFNRTFDKSDPKGCKGAASSIPAALKLLQDDGSASMADYDVEATCDPAKARTSTASPAFRIKTAFQVHPGLDYFQLNADFVDMQHGLSQQFVRDGIEHAGVTGLVLTKLDGSAKGGFVLAVQEKTNIPIKLIGQGEGIGDLTGFTPHVFAQQLVG